MILSYLLWICTLQNVYKNTTLQSCSILYEQSTALLYWSIMFCHISCHKSLMPKCCRTEILTWTDTYYKFYMSKEGAQKMVYNRRSRNGSRMDCIRLDIVLVYVAIDRDRYVSKKLVYLNHLTQLSTWEDFIEFCCQGSLKTYRYMSKYLCTFSSVFCTNPVQHYIKVLFSRKWRSSVEEGGEGGRGEVSIYGWRELGTP